MRFSSDIVTYLAGFIGVVGILTASYFFVQNQDQKSTIETLLQDRNNFLQESNTRKAALAAASTTIEELQLDLATLREDLEDLADDYSEERDKNGEFEDQIRDLAGTLGDLDKLAKTDKELLQKYSKVYFLNENYIPEKLKAIDNSYLMVGKEIAFFHTRAMSHLEDLLDDAAEAGVDLKVVSAYRSFDEQTSLKGQYTQTYGTGANTFSADQGYSEHQLGTTIDLTVPAVGGAYTSFADTEAYKWLLDNAYKYGFILSYPENNAYYIFEPWHWRFVGTELARDLNKSGQNFYELDQRDIDKYLLNLFE